MIELGKVGAIIADKQSQNFKIRWLKSNALKQVLFILAVICSGGILYLIATNRPGMYLKWTTSECSEGQTVVSSMLKSSTILWIWPVTSLSKHFASATLVSWTRRLTRGLLPSFPILLRISVTYLSIRPQKLRKKSRQGSSFRCSTDPTTCRSQWLTSLISFFQILLLHSISSSMAH